MSQPHHVVPTALSVRFTPIFALAIRGKNIESRLGILHIGLQESSKSSEIIRYASQDIDNVKYQRGS